MKHSYIYFLFLISLVSCGQEKGVLEQVNFSINGFDIAPTDDIVGIPDGNSQDKYIVKVDANERVTLKDLTRPEKLVKKRLWFLNNVIISDTEDKSLLNVKIVETGKTHELKLCVNEDLPANCVTKFIWVRDKEPEPPAVVASSSAEPFPPVTEQEDSSSVTTNLGGQNVTDTGGSESKVIMAPGPDTLVKSEPPPRPIDSVPTKTPEPPQTVLEKSKTIGYSRSAFDGCDKFSTGGVVTLKVKKDVELRGFTIHADHCGKLTVALSGNGVSKRVDYSLVGSTQSINLSDFNTRLEGGSDYSLKLSLSGSSTCKESAVTPKLGNLASCRQEGNRPSDQISLNYNGNIIIYDLQYYY